MKNSIDPQRLTIKMSMSKYNLIVTFLLIISGISGISAQQILPSTGGTASGSGGAVSYTVGQVICKTHSSSAGSLSEGVQQPFEISVVTDVYTYNAISLESVVFPNPTMGRLTLKTEFNELDDLAYQLVDNRSRLIRTGRINGMETSIDMELLLPAVYYLKVSKNNISLKVFKIIKK